MARAVAPTTCRAVGAGGIGALAAASIVVTIPLTDELKIVVGIPVNDNVNSGARVPTWLSISVIALMPLGMNRVGSPVPSRRRTAPTSVAAVAAATQAELSAAAVPERDEWPTS